MENTTNFMQCEDFFHLVYLALYVTNRYHDILSSVPDLTLNDVEIAEVDHPVFPCPEISIRIPLTFNATPANMIDAEDIEEFWSDCRDNLQEYFDILVYTNRENIRPLRAPDRTPYNPIFVNSVEATRFFMTIRIAYVDTPLAYHQMKYQLKNQHQPDIGLY